MKLEPIIQSEVSHKEKHQYSILMHAHTHTHTHIFRKTVTATLYARQQRDTDVKNRLLDYVGEGEGGMI